MERNAFYENGTYIHYMGHCLHCIAFALNKLLAFTRRAQSASACKQLMIELRRKTLKTRIENKSRANGIRC